MDTWLYWILTSALVLSFYDLSKKASVRDNAVFPTLFGSTAFGWLSVTAWVLCQHRLANVVHIPASHVVLLLVKSCIVGASWSCTYYALKTLAITSAAPIRATGPFWTLIGAILIFREIPTVMQGMGMAMVLIGCYLFSLSAKHEGVTMWKDRSVIFAFLGTFFGSCSALYDKHLLQGLHMPTGTTLWWFMGGMCIIYGMASIGCRVWPGVDNGITKSFQWRWTIPAVGILLAISDACYFNAIATEGARISILSMVRRSSVVLTFLIGGAIFHETNLKRKAFALMAILAGVVFLCHR